MIPRQRFHARAGYQPKVYGYGRVSHKNQFDKGDSIESQEKRCREYYESRKDIDKDVWRLAKWEGFYAEDSAQSAYSKDFSRRPKGKELISILQPGDHLVIDKLDRMFRDFTDFGIQIRWFAEHGVRLHFVSMLGMSFDSGCPGGLILIGNMALLAQMDSMIKSQNVKNARSALRAKGLHDGTHVLWYYKFIPGPDGKKYGGGGHMEWKPGARQMFERIVAEIDVADKDPWTIARELNMEMIGPRQRFGHWSYAIVMKYYWRERAYRYMGYPDINTIRVKDLHDTYRLTDEYAKAYAIFKAKCKVWVAEGKNKHVNPFLEKDDDPEAAV